MIDLGRETDGNNEICLGVRFALCIKFVYVRTLIHDFRILSSHLPRKAFTLVLTVATVLTVANCCKLRKKSKRVQGLILCAKADCVIEKQDHGAGIKMDWIEQNSLWSIDREVHSSKDIEKICKLKSTNQYNVRSEWHWFVRFNLQIFSCCVCHLEQPHAQSPFLFPIVFSIYWGEPQRAPQLRVDLDFRHSRYKWSVRPLGLVPATIEPKSRANPVLRLCLPLALIDDDFLSKGCRFKSPVLCFFTHCIGCSAALWDKLDLNFFDKRSVLLYPSQDFQTQEIDDWHPKFRFRLWWPLIDWLLSAMFGEGARKHWENKQCEESNPQGRNGRAWENPGRHRHFVISRPGLAFIASPCIAWQVARDRWHLLERARLRFHRRKTERVLHGSPHNACIL